MNRREFTKLTTLASLVGVAPPLAFATEPNNVTDDSTSTDTHLRNRILVLIELEGGNDGLNTLIPLRNRSIYEKLRPTLAQKKAIDIGDDMGMHTSLLPLKSLWDQGQLSWIQNVGYPKPDRSHFRSKYIWETATVTNHQVIDGWLSQVVPEKKQGLHGVVVGSGLGPMIGKRCRSVAMHDPRSFITQARLVDAIDYRSSNPSVAHVIDTQNQLYDAKYLLERSSRIKSLDRYFRRSNFNNDLRSVAQMIVGGAEAMVYKVTLPGFDTHANQAVTHKNQLYYLAEGLDSFSKAMKAAEQWDNVLVMTYSEFGRSLKENLSGGTDHGTSAPQLVMGGRIKGGKLFGESPDLKDLDVEGDIHYTTDFRSLYATVATLWWKSENPWSAHSAIPFI